MAGAKIGDSLVFKLWQAKSNLLSIEPLSSVVDAATAAGMPKQVIAPSDAKWDNVADLFWLGSELDWTAQTVLRGAPKERIVHGLTQSYQHCSQIWAVEHLFVGGFSRHFFPGQHVSSCAAFVLVSKCGIPTPVSSRDSSTSLFFRTLRAEIASAMACRSASLSELPANCRKRTNCPRRSARQRTNRSATNRLSSSANLEPRYRQLTLPGFVPHHSHLERHS